MKHLFSRYVRAMSLFCIFSCSVVSAASTRGQAAGTNPVDRAQVTVAQDGDGDLNGNTGSVIRKALARLAVRGGGTLVIRPGTYTLRRALDLTKVHDITIVGTPETILKAAPGRLVRTTSAVSPGDIRLPVEDSGVFQPGARIEIRSPGRTDVSPAGVRHTVPYSMAVVDRVEDRALLLTKPLRYPASAGVEVLSVYNGIVVSAPAIDITLHTLTIDMARDDWPKAPLNHTYHCAVFARGAYSYSKGPTGPPVERLRIVNCTLRNAHQRGVAFYSVVHSGVYGCRIVDTGAEGIDFDHFSYYCEAVGNRLANVANIELNDASWCLVSGNRLENSIAGIVVWQWCQLPELNVGNLIIDNQIRNSRGDGIACRNGADRNLISGNTVDEARAIGIRIDGRGNVVAGNTIMNGRGPALKTQEESENTVLFNRITDRTQ